MLETARSSLISTVDLTSAVSSPQDSTLSSRISRSLFTKSSHPDNSVTLSLPPTRVSSITSRQEKHISVVKSSDSSTEMFELPQNLVVLFSLFDIRVKLNKLYAYFYLTFICI